MTDFRRRYPLATPFAGRSPLWSPAPLGEGPEEEAPPQGAFRNGRADGEHDAIGASDDFSLFERAADRGLFDGRRGPDNAAHRLPVRRRLDGSPPSLGVHDMMMRGHYQNVQPTYFLAGEPQGAAPKNGDQRQKGDGQPNRAQLFQQYVTERFKLTPEEQKQMAGDAARWSALHPFGALTVAGATVNPDGTATPKQDAAFRSLFAGIRDPKLREKALREYENSITNGELIIGDQPKRP